MKRPRGAFFYPEDDLPFDGSERQIKKVMWGRVCKRYSATVEESSSLLTSLLAELSEISDEVEDETSDTGALLPLLCGAGSSFLHAANASIPQQRARESARVNIFFILSS